MTSPRFRRHRRHRQAGRAPAFTGDFHGDDRDITEIISRADWDGRTYQFTGASSPGLPDGAIFPAPPRVHSAAGRGWAMTVNTAAPAIPMDVRLRRARQYLELEVADLAAQGMLYRVDEAERVRERGEDLDERSVIAATVSKAVRHLLGPREPWGPR